MSISSRIRSWAQRLKSALHLPWSRLPWSSLFAFVALVLSGATFYRQFHARYFVTATVINTASTPVNADQSTGAQKVSVQLAFWNRGNRPAVISSGNLVFDACPELRSAVWGAIATATTPLPLVVRPGEIILETLKADVYPSAIVPSQPPKCGGAVRSTSRTLYVDVFLSAIQSDGHLALSAGPAGKLQGPTSGLHLNDRFGSIKSTAAAPYILLIENSLNG